MHGIGRMFLLAFVVTTPAIASEGPQPAPLPPTVPAARDVPFPGTITLSVDATDSAHRLYRVHETIPVQTSGRFTLLYPQWETGSHAPTASVANLAGLVIQAEGRRLEWQRDPVNAFAFHVDVPADARTLDIDFQYLSPFSSRQGMVTMTPDIATVNWQSLLLYPAGWFVRNIPVSVDLRLPAGFDAVTALDKAAGNPGHFAVTSLETLVDSPVFAARHVGRYDLTPPGDAPVRLTTLSADATSVTVPPEQLRLLRAMVVQTRKLLPARHYTHYDFMLALDDTLPGPGGIEQAQSSADVLPVDFFTQNASNLVNRDLLAHEYVHSWNGRYRQPADLWAADFNSPMRGSLLWVYEGQTEFWGRVLAARAGLRSRQETLDALAVGASNALGQRGRAWKSLQDTTNDPVIGGHGMVWRDWQRREDYYGEGVVLWLIVDGMIREQTRDTKSIDDFARAFFGGGHEGDLTTHTYTFDDVCATLQRIAPYDWASFLRKRLDSHDTGDVLDGLERQGYRLVYDGTPSEYFRQSEADDGARNFTSAIGATIGKGGVIRSVSWEGPAFQAGLAPGVRIDMVNGQPYTPERIEAVLDTASPAPLQLSISVDEKKSSITLHPTGPLRYPHLQRIEGTPDRLSELLAPQF